jgi:hypothetical protein
VNARQRYDDICDALTSWHDDVRRSVIFGMPCLKKSGRVFLGFPRREPSMVFKLTNPEAHARALALPGAHLFDPSGRGAGCVSWVNLPVPPDPLHWSADADRRPRRRVVVPPTQADEWESLAMDALRGDHAPR